jgi:hypothetical protein
MRDLGGGWGDITGEPRRTEVTDTGGPTRLSMVVAVSVGQGVEKVCAGDWEGVAGERAGHILRGKQAMTAKHSQPVKSLFRDWKTRRWILKPKGISKQAERVSVKGGGRHAGGCWS